MVGHHLVHQFLAVDPVGHLLDILDIILHLMVDLPIIIKVDHILHLDKDTRHIQAMVIINILVILVLLHRILKVLQDLHPKDIHLILVDLVGIHHLVRGTLHPMVSMDLRLQGVRTPLHHHSIIRDIHHLLKGHMDNIDPVDHLDPKVAQCHPQDLQVLPLDRMEHMIKAVEAIQDTQGDLQPMEALAELRLQGALLVDPLQDLEVQVVLPEVDPRGVIQAALQHLHQVLEAHPLPRALPHHRLFQARPKNGHNSLEKDEKNSRQAFSLASYIIFVFALINCCLLKHGFCGNMNKYKIAFDRIQYYYSKFNFALIFMWQGTLPHLVIGFHDNNDNHQSCRQVRYPCHPEKSN